MRLLHAGHSDDAYRVPARQSGPNRTRGAHRHFRESVPTLLGVGFEYIASAVSYFERMRQIEETCEHIIVLAGPISYLLASDAFDQALGEILRESIPDALAGRKRALDQVDEIIAVLHQRKDTYRRRQP